MNKRYKQKEIERAKKKVKAKKKFYQHLGVFVVINVFLVVLNLLTSPKTFWFQFPFLGWGIAIAIHYFNAFGFPGTKALDEELEELELRKEMNKNKNQNEKKEEVLEEELELKELRKNYDEQDLV